MKPLERPPGGEGAVEAFDLAVRLRPVWPGPLVGDVEFGAGRGDYVVAWQPGSTRAPAVPGSASGAGRRVRPSARPGHPDIAATLYVRAGDTFAPVAGFDEVDVVRVPSPVGAYSHTQPAVGKSADGTVSVVCVEDNDGNGTGNIAISRFAADGTPLVSGARASADPAGHQSRPAIAVDAAGDAAVVRHQRPTPTSPTGGYAVSVRSFDPT